MPTGSFFFIPSEVDGLLPTEPVHSEDADLVFGETEEEHPLTLMHLGKREARVVLALQPSHQPHQVPVGNILRLEIIGQVSETVLFHQR